MGAVLFNVVAMLRTNVVSTHKLSFAGDYASGVPARLTTVEMVKTSVK